jgi:phosphoribosylanthranilate isomerase
MAKIKFCGMTNLGDCEKAIELSVDFLGFVFYKKSARCVTPEDVRHISEKLDGRVTTVGVFVEENDDEIARLMDFCRLDYCQVYRTSIVANSIIAYRIKDRLKEDPVSKGLILLDSYSQGVGGSGKSFDLGILKGASFMSRAFIAGGLAEETVSEALRLKPFGVDLVSSIELCPGKKDHRKMEAFVNKVRSFRL